MDIQKWEYDFIDAAPQTPIMNVTLYRLRELGRQGWEAVSWHELGILVKRPLQETSSEATSEPTAQPNPETEPVMDVKSVFEPFMAYVDVIREIGKQIRKDMRGDTA